MHSGHLVLAVLCKYLGDQQATSVDKTGVRQNWVWNWVAIIQSRLIILTDNKVTRIYLQRTVHLDMNKCHVVLTIRRHKRSYCSLVQANPRSIGRP